MRFPSSAAMLRKALAVYVEAPVIVVGYAMGETAETISMNTLERFELRAHVKTCRSDFAEWNQEEVASRSFGQERRYETRMTPFLNLPLSIAEKFNTIREHSPSSTAERKQMPVANRGR